MSSLNFPTSIPLCATFAAAGGILEVFATAVLAWPAARMLEGYKYSDGQLRCALATNIVLQIVASLCGNMLSTWYGPVSIVGPIFFAAQLLANLIVFWVVLGLEAFSFSMNIGTFVIVVSVILLTVNGPAAQDYGNTTFEEIISVPKAMIWSIILMIGMLVAGLIVLVVDLSSRKPWQKYAVLLTSRASAFAILLSTGKALVLPCSQAWLITNIVLKVVSGGIYTRAIVVQSTIVEQKTFVPVNAVTIMFVNAVTGILVWQDYYVIYSWLGYICVFLLMALGCSLLLGDLGLLEEASPDTFRAARPNIVFRSERDKVISNLRNIPSIRHLDEDEESPYFHSRSEGFITPAGSSFKRGGAMMRKRASVPWSSERLLTNDGGSDNDVPVQRPVPQVNDIGRTTEQPSRTTSPVPSTTKQAPNSRRPSFLRPTRSLQSQAAWAAIYESSHAVHPDHGHHHSDPCPTTKKENDTASTNDTTNDDRRQVQSTRPSLRGGMGKSARGWESFRHHLLNDLIEEDDDDDVESPEAVDGDADNNDNNEINMQEEQAASIASFEKNTATTSTSTSTLGTSVESLVHEQNVGTTGGENNENGTRLSTTAEVGEEDGEIEEA
mmetsp:Transcript_39179/g.94734  ORF Transcript_39179/g.94734 Transcript_39179/m.94734 type:complete len:610 (-) Transcript_39179:494-2323(-)